MASNEWVMLQAAFFIGGMYVVGFGLAWLIDWWKHHETRIQRNERLLRGEFDYDDYFG